MTATGASTKALRQLIDHDVEQLLAATDECCIADTARDLFNQGSPWDGVSIGFSLRRLGWRRDGWIYTGYDRSPRWVRGAPE